MKRHQKNYTSYVTAALSVSVLCIASTPLWAGFLGLGGGGSCPAGTLPYPNHEHACYACPPETKPVKGKLCGDIPATLGFCQETGEHLEQDNTVCVRCEDKYTWAGDAISGKCTPVESAD